MDTEGGTCRMVFDKSVQIKQITVVEAHGILIFRTDKGNRILFWNEIFSK